MQRYWFLYVILILFTESSQANESRPASIYGTIFSSNGGDSVEMIYHDYMLNNSGLVPAPQRFYSVPRRGFYYGRAFHFVLPAINRPGYISLKCGNNYFLMNYLVLPGDSVEIVFDRKKNQTLFSGKSAAAFKCQYELSGLDLLQDYEKGTILVTNSPDNFLNRDQNRLQYEQDMKDFGFIGKVMKMVPDSGRWHLERLIATFANPPHQRLIDVLNLYQASLEPVRYNILKADIIGKAYAPELRTFYNRLYPKARKANDSVQLGELRNVYDNFIASITPNQFDNQTQEYSAYYSEYLINRAFVESIILSDSLFVYDRLKRDYSGRLLDKLIGKYLVDNYRYMKNAESRIKDALQFVKVPEVYAALSKYDSNQSKGSDAYDFRLQDYYGNWVNMENLKGKIVLVDFWYTGCMPCKWFGSKTLKPVKEYFKDRDDFVVLSVSIDRDVKTWKKSVEEGEYTNEKAVNVYTMGEGDEHAMIRHYDVRSYPTVILIDRDGKISITSGLNTSAAELISILEKQLGNKPVVSRD